MTAVAAALLAGCGGGGGSGLSTVPAGHGALLAPQTVATPSGTLYYEDTTSAYAIPLGSSGAVTATSSIKPHPNQSRVNEGLASNVDGTLAMLQLYEDMGSVQHCQAVVEPVNANGSPAASNVYCDTTPGVATQGEGIARNGPNGGFDVLYNTTSSYVLKRYSADGSTLLNTMTFSGYAPLWLATDRGGHDHVLDNAGEIRKYHSSVTDPTTPAADCVFNAPYGDGPFAVAPDQSAIYAAVKSEGDIANEYIIAYTTCTGGTPGSPTAITGARGLGPFPNKYVTALAVDTSGNLYVAMSNVSNTGNAVIRVYAPDANVTNGVMPAPLRIINPSPATNFIRGLAIAQ